MENIDKVGAAAGILLLQRLAGNAAVTRLVAQAGRTSTTQARLPTQAFVQRDATATAVKSRPGAAWPYGPVSQRKSAVHDIATYIQWVKEVEQAYGPDKQAVLQRLRRLYYSTASGGGVGRKFDKIIEDQAGASYQESPISAPPITTRGLDGLYETDAVRMPDKSGDVVDISHVLAGLDLQTAGLTFGATTIEAGNDVKMIGVVTWAGDLASWFIDWVDRRRKKDAIPRKGPATEEGPPEESGTAQADDLAMLTESAKSKTSKEDLLGDMDAEVMAAQDVRPSTLEHVKAEHRQILHSNIDTELSSPVSTILERYYGLRKGTPAPPESKQRFPAFVRSASPAIPYSTTGKAGPAGSVMLAPEAEAAIYSAIRNTADLFIRLGTSDRSDPLTKYDKMVREITRRFTRFLETGLATGDAPWP